MDLRRKSLGRKGMWTQIFLISFFVLIVIFAIILLSIDANRNVMDSKRKFLDVDLAQQQTDATLISLMRTPVVTDGKTMMLATVISMNNDGRYDALIYGSLESRLGASGVYSIVISSSHPLKLTPPEELTHEIGGKASDVVAGLSTIYLPGNNQNIQVTLIRYNETAKETYKFRREPEVMDTKNAAGRKSSQDADNALPIAIDAQQDATTDYLGESGRAIDAAYKQKSN